MSEPTYLGDGYTRRQALLAVGTGLVAATAGCSETASTTDSPTEDRLTQQFEAVRTATAKYETIDTARRDGYAVLGPYMDGMGWHLIDQQRAAQAAQSGFTRETPPLLTYLDTDDGRRLGAVEYAAPVDAVPANPDLFADDGGERWHTHGGATHVFATPDDSRTEPATLDIETVLTSDNWAEFRPPDPDLAAGDTVALDWGSIQGKSGDRTPRVVNAVITHPALRTLHVWLHEENPDGVFSRTNSRFGSGDGHDHGHDHESTATE